MVEDLGVAELLHARVGAEIAEAELVEDGAVVQAPDGLRSRLQHVELLRQRVQVARRDLAGGVGDHRVALQGADVLRLLRPCLFGLALQFVEISHRLTC
jgi:hypothetical protein